MNVFDKLIEFFYNMTPLQFGILLLVLCTLYLFVKDYGFPPGPTGLPLIGYWPFLKAEICHIQLQKLAKEYGEVLSFWSAGTLFIHLGSTKVIKEAHVTKTDCFAGRFTSYSVLNIIFQDGLLMQNGEPWKVLRKFFVQKFKEYGMNAVKENASCSIYDALKEIVDRLRDAKGQPVQITDLANLECGNIIRRILFNDQGISKEEMEELIHHYGIVLSGMKSTNFLLMGNFAKYVILPLMPDTWRMKRSQKRIDEILKDVVNRHKTEYEENHVADIIDCYFKERDERKKRGDSSANFFTDGILVSSLSQIVTDGLFTVGLFIGTLLMSLVDHPEEQERVYNEILEVVGPDRLPNIEDKTKLPYTNAFIYEVMRVSDLFPLFPSLQCTKETTIQGYKIPVGSVTLLNTYAAHYDPNTYEDPESFNPCRFLSSSNKPRADLPVTFGVGKRACTGEAFSMIQGFLFLTAIVKNFRLSYPKGQQGLSNMLWSEERLKICAIPRS